MPSDINLIPSEVVKERSLKKTHSRLLIGSIVFIGLIVIVAAVVIFLQTRSVSKLNATKSRIQTKRDEIESLKEVERKASALTAKLDYVDHLLSSKIYYSRVMNELDLRSKTGITLTQVDVDATYEVIISGLSTSTTNLQTYIDGLVKGPDNLFTNAKVLEVNIKEGSGLAVFKVSVEVDRADLTTSSTEE